MGNWKELTFQLREKIVKAHNAGKEYKRFPRDSKSQNPLLEALFKGLKQAGQSKTALIVEESFFPPKKMRGEWPLRSNKILL